LLAYKMNNVLLTATVFMEHTGKVNTKRLGETLLKNTLRGFVKCKC